MSEGGKRRDAVQNVSGAVATWAPPRVAVIGCGTGRGDLSREAERWIARAEVLAGGRRLLNAFPEHCGRRIEVGSPLEAGLEAVERMSERFRVAVLASGDPLFFGIGKALAVRLGAERLEIVPNVTAVQVLFARLARPWQDVRTFSLHGREDSQQWLEALALGRDVALLTDDRHGPAWIAARLVQRGLGFLPMAVGENLGLEDEAVHTLSADQAVSRSFRPLNVVAVFAQDRAPRPPSVPAALFGIDDNAFAHQQGLITKREVRAVVLALLGLQPGQVLWDLGAGSGAVGIEAARLIADLQVVAVEKHPQRYRDLTANIAGLGVNTVQPIAGDAVDVMADLPDPDRVFIGGSGGRLVPVLDRVRSRLRPQGRVVLSAVTLENLHRAWSFWRDCGWQATVTQIQVSRGTAVGDAVRLEALNPVFIVTAEPEPAASTSSQAAVEAPHCGDGR